MHKGIKGLLIGFAGTVLLRLVGADVFLVELLVFCS